jgi:hypothetical protein
MDAKIVRAPQRCLERERLVREWTECSNRLMRLQGVHGEFQIAFKKLACRCPL